MKIITFLYILFYLIKKCLNYVVYPLKLYNELNQIENYLSFNSTYTTLEIGTPPQKVDFYFNLNDNKMCLTQKNCNGKNLFDIDNSETLVIIGYLDKEQNSHYNQVFALDKITFYDNINLTEKITPDKFYIYYNSDINKKENHLCGNIGLSIIKNETKMQNDEIEYYLQYIKEQNEYFSFFHYKNQDFFVNSIFLHQEFKDLFIDVKDIVWEKPILKDNSYNWEIYMKEIYYNNTNIKGKIIFQLNPLFELIIGSNDYKKNIFKDFFEFYINNKTCLINEIKGYQIIECDANGFGIKDIKQFPNLYMLNYNLNNVFVMIGEELFIKLNNKYYFCIIFVNKNTQNNNKWIMGKIFLRKYPIIFSPINKKIGFYINPNGDIRKEITFKKTSIIIIILTFTCFGIWIGRNIFFKRKSEYNELIDNDNDNDNQIGLENKYDINEKKKNTFDGIEMNIK